MQLTRLVILSALSTLAVADDQPCAIVSTETQNINGETINRDLILTAFKQTCAYLGGSDLVDLKYSDPQYYTYRATCINPSPQPSGDWTGPTNIKVHYDLKQHAASCPCPGAVFCTANPTGS